MSREGALWIGSLEPYMDEDFIQKALNQMGEQNLLSIKVIKNKFTGEAAGYGFINFINDHVALTVMHKLNGKLIPNSSPPVRFKLNHNSTRLLPGERDHSIWVGDLTPDVDDLQLFRFFSARFQSIKSAKVVLDASGFSKGYGFIRFGNEQEQQTALSTMAGLGGLGTKPIKVSLAIAKGKEGLTPTHTSHIPSSLSQPQPPPQPTQQQDYSAYYDQYNQYWSQYAAWSQYNQQYYDYSQAGAAAQAPAAPPPVAAPAPTRPPPAPAEPNTSLTKGDLYQVVEHSLPVSTHRLNKEVLERSQEFWEAVEGSRWWGQPQVAG